MKKGIKSLTESVMEDCKNGENCFNKNGCDHEFYRIVPEDNPKLIEMGFKTACLKVSKCFHKYCDKYKWAVERAKHYADKTGKTSEEILEVWENDRTFWYMNYYQDCNQPLAGRNLDDKSMFALQEQMKFLSNEISTYDFLSTTLTQEHQQSIKNDLIKKSDNMKQELENCKLKIKLYEISCFGCSANFKPTRTKKQMNERKS